jgi:AAA15 family ATPase/GTPase
MPYSLNLFREDANFRSYLTEVIADADMGIARLDVVQKQVSEVELPAELPDEVRKRVLAKPAEYDLMTWIFTHLNRESGEEAKLFVNQEAAGTQRLLALSGPWWDTLQNGYTLVVDELDCSLHPHLVRKLVQIFQSPIHNPSGAQLVFATHDATLLDLSLLRRDQVWLVEKHSSGASRMFSLWDYRETPRKQEAILRGYLGGRYGGVPSFGPTLEAVE